MRATEYIPRITRRDWVAVHEAELEARQLLSASPYLPLRWIDCYFERGKIVLDGEVPSFYLKQMAQAAVLSVEGISEVENRLRLPRNEGG